MSETEGDYGRGAEHEPHEHKGSFAEGEETLPREEHEGSFAEGEEHEPHERKGSFSDTDEDD
jgi:hypothetical protein